MTPQERELLERFLSDLMAARLGQKDPQAEALIRDAAARQPDAVYLLVQRAIQLDQALQLTQAQMQKLQAELDATRDKSGSGGGFLSDPYAWGSQPTGGMPPSGAAQAPSRFSRPQQSVSGQPLQAVPAAAQPQQPMAAPARPSAWGGGSGMLGTIAGTAAGVVGGAFLFQGIESLMHHNTPAAGAATPTPTPHGLTGDTQASEPLRLGDPSLTDDTPVDDDSDYLASDDGAGSDDDVA